MSDEDRLRWAEVEPLGVVNGELNHVFAKVDTLHETWELSLAQASRPEFDEARRRSLRRHAIETGIIERLYPDWGITETKRATTSARCCGFPCTMAHGRSSLIT